MSIKKKKKKWAYIRKEKASYRLYIKNLLGASSHTYSDVNWISPIIVTSTDDQVCNKGSNLFSPWCNHTGWLGLKHQVTYFLKSARFHAGSFGDSGAENTFKALYIRFETTSVSVFDIFNAQFFPVGVNFVCIAF